MGNAHWLDGPITWLKAFYVSGIAVALVVVAWGVIICWESIKKAIGSNKSVVEE